MEVEAENIITRFDKIIPILTQVLQDGVTNDKVDDNRSDSGNEDEDENEAMCENETRSNPMNDKCLYNALSCVGKIFAKVSVFLTSKKHTESVTKFMGTLVCILQLKCYSEFTGWSGKILLETIYSFVSNSNFVNHPVLCQYGVLVKCKQCCIS